MVHADRRDHAGQWFFDRVGGVEPSAEADFQQQGVGRVLREHNECGCGLDLEHGDRRAGVRPLAALQRILQFVVADENAATGAAEPNTFVEPHQIGRGVGVDAQTRRFQRRAQIGDRRTLAVGAGDMDHRRQFSLGMVEPFEQPVDAIEVEIDAARMQGRDPRDHFAER